MAFTLSLIFWVKEPKKQVKMLLTHSSPAHRHTLSPWPPTKTTSTTNNNNQRNILNINNDHTKPNTSFSNHTML